MSDELRVRLYVRPPVAGWCSIERVFRAVVEHLPSDIFAQLVTVTRPATGLFGRLRAIAEVFTRARCLHHVTGDVHFLVLGLPSRRTMLTVHDLTRLHELSGLRRLIYRFLWFELPVRRAAVVTVISEQTRRDLLDEFPHVAKKLSVIPNPLPSGLGPSVGTRDSHGAKVILHVGTTENKNLGLSMAVAQQLGAELSILGRLDQAQLSALDRAGVVFRAQHDVPDERLGDIYTSADVLLFASFAEGFGLPIIEAQACGVPVVTSDREPMRSVAGGAALFVDPYDRDAATEAVAASLAPSSLREDLIEAGYANVSRFTAAAVAEAYANIYRDLAAKLR